MLRDLVLDGLTHGRARFAGEDRWTPAITIAEGATPLFSTAAPCSTVAAMLTNDRATAEVVLGAITTGSRLVSLPLPPRAADFTAYRAHIESIVRTFGIEEIVARDDAASLLAAIGLPARPHSALTRRPIASPSERGFELVQFTSGSTGNPKAIVLTDAALEANIRAVLGRIAPTDEDRVVSWLPLSHDLGLVAMFLAPIVGGGSTWAGGGDLMVMDPEQFLRNPPTWADSLSEHQGTITAAPDFALRMAASQPPSPPADLSRLRCLVIGGEIIRPDTLRTFTATFEEKGFNSTALSPAYGLAEVGVAVTLCAPEEHWTSHRTAGAESAGPGRGREVPPFEVVACGPPISGYEVETERSDAPGTIRIKGPSTGIDGLSGRSLADPDGWLTTGDAGTLRDGRLLVVGRHDDTIVVHGRNVFAPPIERTIGAMDGVRPGRVALTGLPSGGWIVALEVLRGTDAAQRARIRARVRSETASLAGIRPDEIAILPPGALPMTASGKLQRRELQRRFVAGTLGGS